MYSPFLSFSFFIFCTSWWLLSCFVLLCFSVFFFLLADFNYWSASIQQSLNSGSTLSTISQKQFIAIIIIARLSLRTCGIQLECLSDFHFKISFQSVIYASFAITKSSTLCNVNKDKNKNSNVKMVLYRERVTDC